MSHPISSHGPGQVPYPVYGLVPLPALTNGLAFETPVFVTMKYPSDSDEYFTI